MAEQLASVEEIHFAQFAKNKADFDYPDFDYLGPRVVLFEWCLSDGEYTQANSIVSETIELLPPHDWYYGNRLAWTLTTTNSEEVRDGRLALQLAKRACELTDYKSSRVLDTLAGAYAETGEFGSAVKWSRRACELADDENRRQLFTKHLEVFESGEPWRQIISK